MEMLKSQNYEGISDITISSIPKIGYIALLGQQPIACGFLRRMEGNYAQLDGLTSNARFGSKIRHEGIKLVVEALIQEAKDLKLHGIIATTKDQGILDRAKSIGFNVVPQTIISLKL
jgi:hypothetical protein